MVEPLRWAYYDGPGQAARVEAGVDEAGRGCLAGPVFAAAVVWPQSAGGLRPPLIRDSKKLSASQRERVRALIEAEALAWGVGSVDAAEIDRTNILKASMRAMRNALDDLYVRFPDIGRRLEFLVVDGERFDGYATPPSAAPSDPDGAAGSDLLPYACVVDADSQFLSVAAASVLAKTHRDRFVLEQMHPRFPHYGWDRSKCYGTRAHYDALGLHGPCELHRRSFRLAPKALP